MKLDNHPTVKAYNEKKTETPVAPKVIDTEWLKQQAFDAGADDVGIIDLERNTMAPYRQGLKQVMPEAGSVMVLCFHVHQSALQTPAHSIADAEFKYVWNHANAVARKITGKLLQTGIKCVNPPAGFPYEARLWPQKMWITNDKIFAIEAGLGRMGWSRLLLHKEFGAAVMLGCVLIGAPCDHYDQPLEFNPCLECGLCVKVCPVGAVKKENDFNFITCISHNYRERLGGFLDWVEQVVESKNRADYRKRVEDSETISMWQNLSMGAQTRCDRCMAVCPVGQDMLGEYLEDRKAYSSRNLKPFADLTETIYVVKGSDAENYVKTKFPAKKIKFISNGIRPASAKNFLASLPLAFQKTPS